MTVAELIDELRRWPQDATVVKSDDNGNFHDVGQVDETTSYNTYAIVID